MDKIMNYIVFLGFVYLLYISFKRNRSLFHPSNFFVLLWFVNYFVLMFFVHDFTLHFAGSAFILLMCTIAYMGSHIGMNVNLKKQVKNIQIIDIIKSLKFISIFLSIIGFCVVPLMLIYIKGDILSLFNLKYIQNISMYVSYLRYRTDFQFPLYIQMFLGLNYFAALINGLYFGYRYYRKKTKVFYIYFIPVLTSIFISMITTEKAVIIFTTLFFITSFFVTYNALAKHEFKISLKKGLFFTSAFIFTLLLFIYIQMNRRGFSDISGFREVVRSFKTYAFGHISAFSIWLKDYFQNPQGPSFGRYTIAGVYSFFNIYEREPGIFTDFSLISKEPLLTNVYTAYRGLISDFSIIGTCIIMSIFSFLSGIAYKYYKYSILAFIYLIFFYCVVVISLFTSLLNYNTLLGSFILLLFTFLYYKFALKKASNSIYN